MSNLGQNNGDVLVFGYNYYGRLGHNNDNLNIPTLLMQAEQPERNDTTIRNIICGIYHPRLCDLYYLHNNI